MAFALPLLLIAGSLADEPAGVRLPLFNFSCLAQRVWIGPPTRVAPGAACGAEISTSDEDTATAWRNLVDSLPSEALVI